MSAGTRAVLMSIWVLATGLAAVFLEVESVRGGARVRQLMEEKDARLEAVRKLELRYNRMLCPDLLEKDLGHWDGGWQKELHSGQ